MTVLLRNGAAAATYTYNAFGERIAKVVNVYCRHSISS